MDANSPTKFNHFNPYPYSWQWPMAAVTGWEVEIHPGQVACPSWVTDKCTVKWQICACPWRLYELPLIFCSGSWVPQVDLQLLVAKPWRRAFIVSLLNYVCWWGAQQPYILWRGLEKVPCCWQIEAKCLFYETHQCNSVTVMFFCFFLNIKQFDLTANYICITCYLFSFTLYKVKLKPVERLLKG